jgi:hypothetical protein
MEVHGDLQICSHIRTVVLGLNASWDNGRWLSVDFESHIADEGTGGLLNGYGSPWLTIYSSRSMTNLKGGRWRTLQPSNETTRFFALPTKFATLI